MIVEPVMPSGSIAVTAGQAITAKPALLYNLVLNPGSAVSTVTVYDNASAASGTVLASLTSPANGASIIYPSSNGIYAKNGLFIVVTGTAATATLTYQPENG